LDLSDCEEVFTFGTDEFDFFTKIKITEDYKIAPNFKAGDWKAEDSLNRKFACKSEKKRKAKLYCSDNVTIEMLDGMPVMASDETGKKITYKFKVYCKGGSDWVKPYV